MMSPGRRLYYVHANALREAEVVIESLIDAMPAPLQQRAREIGYHLWRGDEKPETGDLLGEYLEESDWIVLYLENIWRYAGETGASFHDEIRTTYLHELGHFLGLEEDDLEDRGLD